MKKTNEKYIVILVALPLLIAGGVIVSNWNTETTPTEAVQILEPVTARIDVSTKPYTKEARFVIYGSNKQKISEAIWLKNLDSRGYAIQKEGNENIFTIKVISDTDIKLLLRGKWELDEAKKTIKHWVDYTSLSINGEEILSETTAVWHDKPFGYTIHAKAGETYIVSAKWQKHTENSR